MNCKDCINYDICKKFDCLFFDECSYFKDESQLVELPCKYSDTIYSIYGGKYQEYKINGFLHTANGSYLVLKTIPKQEEHIYHQMFLNDFLFFTRSEAEKALAERSASRNESF